MTGGDLPGVESGTDTTRHAALGPGEEFARIAAIWRRLGDRAAPAGDDAALVEIGGVALALSNDLSIEGRHFRRGWLAPDEIGYRATMAALSDLAAVAARPRGVVVGLGVSREDPDWFAEEIMAGVGEAAVACDTVVLGGDLIESSGITLDVCVIGEVPTAALRRSGAEVGDVVAVTGVLGGPAAALDAWYDGREPERWARDRFARPGARVSEALWLAAVGANAAIDVSDGLAADAEHLAAASALRIVLDLDRIPAGSGIEPSVAATGGEEYELLVTLPADRAASIVRDFDDRFDIALTRVGRVEQGAGVEVRRDGETVPLAPGYRRFEGRMS